jgi:hypothetical protein
MARLLLNITETVKMEILPHITAQYTAQPNCTVARLLLNITETIKMDILPHITAQYTA